jgi:hypothetical protein
MYRNLEKFSFLLGVMDDLRNAPRRKTSVGTEADADGGGTLSLAIKLDRVGTIIRNLRNSPLPISSRNRNSHLQVGQKFLDPSTLAFA